jgi:prepilin-type processing-associated H-X9-DG protein
MTGGGQGNGCRLGVPASFAGQDGKVPGCLGGGQRVPGSGGGHLCPVGGHPAELLVIQLDQHPRGQRVDPGQQCAGLFVIVGSASEGVAARDQPGEPGREAAVAAGTEIVQGISQAVAQFHTGYLDGDKAEHRVSYACGEPLSGSGLFRRNRCDAVHRCRSGGHHQVCQQLPSPHRVFTALPSGSTSHGRGRNMGWPDGHLDWIPVSRPRGNWRRGAAENLRRDR